MGHCFDSFFEVPLQGTDTFRFELLPRALPGATMGTPLRGLLGATEAITPRLVQNDDEQWYTGVSMARARSCTIRIIFKRIGCKPLKGAFIVAVGNARG